MSDTTPPPLGDHSADRPYEPVPDGPVNLLGADLFDIAAGSVTVAAVAVPLEAGAYPGLVFTFTDPDGNAIRPRVLLVLDEDQLAKFPEVIAGAANGAIAGARQANA